MLLILLFILIPSIWQVLSSSPQGTKDRYYVGVSKCRKCHQGGDKKSPYNVWHNSKHSQAYKVLAWPVSKQIAELSGIDVNPLSSPICLKCHTTASDAEAWQRDESFSMQEGIQCETCHGPGSEYSEGAIMADKQAAKKAGLQMPDKDFCLVCHLPKGSHTAFLKNKTFDYKTFLNEIKHYGKAVKPNSAVPAIQPAPVKVPVTQITPTEPAHIQYKTPFNLVLSADGKKLYVACESSDSLIIIDTKTHRLLAEITVQNQPHGVCPSKDGKLLFVSNRGSDTITVIDTTAYRVVKHIAVGDEPHGIATGTGNTIYVANAGSSDISVVDFQKGTEIKRLSAGHGSWAAQSSPDHKSVFITNNFSHYVKFRASSRSEVTVLDAQRSVVTNRIMIPDANLVQGIDFSPDGEFALVTLLRTKNLMPITRVLKGWMITNGIGVIWKDGHVDQLLLDEIDHSFADPTDLVITPDGKYAYVSAGGIDRVAVIDLEKMKHLLKNSDEKRRKEELPNHLGISSEYVLKRIAVGRNPRGLAVSGDGRFVYVADALDDTVSVIAVAQQKRVAVIDLGGPKEITQQRFGERVFHSAEITFGQQFSCHTCHPDGGVDGITYDIEPDGLGLNPVDNRTLRGILDTAPFKWTGKNATLNRQCGPRLAVFFTRIDPFTPEQVTALERYICTIPRNPNRYRKGYRLTPAQSRGKQLFERAYNNAGKEIPKKNRCNYCHSGPYYTNRRMFDTGNRSHLDTQGVFDVPHLNNIYETAPYLHDGRSNTLEEIWTRYNPEDKHGETNDMTKDQLNDLIEYLKTL